MGKLSNGEISPFVLALSNFQDYGNQYAKIQVQPAVNEGSMEKVAPSLMEDMGVMAPQTPYANMVIPLFNFLRRVGWSHFKLEFDLSSQTFRYVPGSVIRKVLCFVVYIVTTVALYAECEVAIYKAGRSNLVALMKINEIAYMSLNTTFFFVLQARGSHIPVILNFMQKLSIVMEKTGCSLPKQATCSKLAKLVIGVLATYGLVYSLESYLTAIHANGSVSFVDHFSRAFTNAIFVATGLASNDSSVLQYNLGEDFPYWVVVGVAVAKLILTYGSALVWINAGLLLIFWGHLFSQIFRSFMKKVGMHSSWNTLEDIRKFNMITGMLDKFNHAMGPLTLTLCVTSIAHFSVHALYLIDSNLWWVSKAIVLFALLYFAALLIILSNVNREASRIVEVIKARFQDANAWHEYHGRCPETTQGLLLLCNEIQSGSVGFKGLDFFTITYSFIGTVLSVISTYAVVALQFKNKE